jgi:hypothetical protein
MSAGAARDELKENVQSPVVISGHINVILLGEVALGPKMLFGSLDRLFLCG